MTHTTSGPPVGRRAKNTQTKWRRKLPSRDMHKFPFCHHCPFRILGKPLMDEENLFDYDYECEDFECDSSYCQHRSESTFHKCTDEEMSEKSRPGEKKNARKGGQEVNTNSDE